MKILIAIALSINILWSQKDQVMIISVYHNMPYTSDTSYYSVECYDFDGDLGLDTVVTQLRVTEYKSNAAPVWAEFFNNDYSFADFGFVDPKKVNYIIRLKFLLLRKE